MLRKNPMDALKKQKTPDVVPTDYFLPEVFEQIVAATEKYEYGGGNDNEHRGHRLRALPRWSGLAILGANSLERERLSTNENDDDQIFLYGAKTGLPVFVIIPNEVGTRRGSCRTRIPAISSGQEMAWQCSQGIPTVILEALQVGRHSEARWNAETLPAPHVPRHLCCRVAAGWRSSRSGISVIGAFHREDYRAPLCKARREQLATSVMLAWKKPTQSLQKKKASSSKKHAKRQDSGGVKRSA
jgi:hypothetical protein